MEDSAASSRAALEARTEARDAVSAAAVSANFTALDAVVAAHAASAQTNYNANLNSIIGLNNFQSDNDS